MDKLPPEILLLIYEQAIDLPLVVKPKHIPEQDFQSLRSILSLSRQAYGLVSEWFYKTRTFQFMLPSSFFPFLNSIGPKNRSCLRTIHLDFCADTYTQYFTNGIDTQAFRHLPTDNGGYGWLVLCHLFDYIKRSPSCSHTATADLCRGCTDQMLHLLRDLSFDDVKITTYITFSTSDRFSSAELAVVGLEWLSQVSTPHVRAKERIDFTKEFRGVDRDGPRLERNAAVVAIRYGHLDVAKAYIRYWKGGNCAQEIGDVLNMSIYSGCFEIAVLLTQNVSIFELMKPNGVDSQSETNPLMLAAERGSEDILELLLRAGADPNVRYRDGMTPLLYAAQWGNLGCVRSLLDAGADVNKRTEGDIGALHLASIFGHEDVLELLISRGASVAPETKETNTPLHLAAYSGRTQCCRILIRHGADWSQMSHEGMAPLHLAAMRAEAGAVEALLDMVDVNFASAFGLTSLHYAAHDHEVSKLLLERGADPSISRDGFTALHSAAMNGHHKTVQLLIESGADLEARASGKTPLMKAAEEGQVESCRMLLTAGADINAVEQSGMTALYMAAAEDKCHIIELLIDCGADLEKTDERGHSAFTAAARLNNQASAEMLLSRGASIKWSDSSGRTMFEFAASRGISWLMDLSLRNGADINETNYLGHTALHTAAIFKQMETVESLIRKGAQLEAKSKIGLTPLHCAAREGSLEISRILLGAGADANARSADGLNVLESSLKYGGNVDLSALLLTRTTDINASSFKGGALHAAVSDPQMLHLLLDHGIDLNLRDAAGDTALHRAVETGDRRSVRVLLDAGVERDAMNDSGLTALSYATRLDLEYELSYDLITMGCNVKTRDPGGWTPLHFAARNGDCELAKALLCFNAELEALTYAGETPLHVAAKYARTKMATCLARENFLDFTSSNLL